MKITLKIGKKDQTIKVKTIEDLGKVTHILYGQILKQDMMPEIAGEKFSCKLDGEKIEPKKLLVLLKDKLKEANRSDSEEKDSKKKKKKDEKKKSKSVQVKTSDKCKSKKKKDKDDEPKKKKKKGKSKGKKTVSLSFNDPKADDGLIHLHRRNKIDD